MSIKINETKPAPLARGMFNQNTSRHVIKASSSSLTDEEALAELMPQTRGLPLWDSGYYRDDNGVVTWWGNIDSSG